MLKSLPLFLLLLLLAASPTLAQEGDGAEPVDTPGAESAPPTGVVTGRVADGTNDDLVAESGEPMPRDWPSSVAMLHIWDGAFQEKEMLHGELSPDGSFRFAGVPFVPGWQYAAMVNYQDATYFSEPVAVGEGQQELSLTVRVFEATSSTDAVRITRQHLFFDAAAGERLQVGEIYILSNDGDRTVILPADADPVTAPLSFPLPAEAQDISLENNDNGRFKPTGVGFVDTAPLRPGEGVAQVVVRYTLPYEDSLDYTFTAPWPVNGLNVLVSAASGLAVAGDGLQAEETRQMGNGDDVAIYSHGPLDAGETLSLNLSGDLVAPAPPPAPASSETTVPVAGYPLLPPAMLVLGLVLVTLAVWLYRRPVSDLVPEAAGQPADFDTLVTEIALLDDAHDEGRVNEDDYTRRRKFLLAQAQQRMPQP